MCKGPEEREQLWQFEEQKGGWCGWRGVSKGEWGAGGGQGLDHAGLMGHSQEARFYSQGNGRVKGMTQSRQGPERVFVILRSHLVTLLPPHGPVHTTGIPFMILTPGYLLPSSPSLPHPGLQPQPSPIYQPVAPCYLCMGCSLS